MGEGVDISDEAGLQKLDALFEVIHTLFVFLLLSGKLLFEVVRACFGGDDESIDDGPVGGGIKGMGGNGAMDRLGRELSEGEKIVDSCGVFSGGYWSIGSGSE